MAGPAGGRDQTSNDPTGNFAGSTPSQFGSSYCPIDTELTNMSANYNLPPYARQMEDAAASIEKIDHGTMNNMPIDTNGAAGPSVVDPGMAPPQTPNQPSFVPTGSRPSFDASAETTQDPQTGDKRKRSKASRACDECRRKKVKCDAPTDVDGTPKTCTNCQKAGVNCEFERKPMKRGPSKGYISALAERVQGLEQKQRQSFDAGPGGFAESFSPDEQTGPGFNRASSFSASTNVNPFATSEYQRDRIPSIGWSPQIPGSVLRSRASGSLAIAPNETFPAPVRQEDTSLKFQPQEPSKTFSGEIFDSRPTKRSRIQGPNEDVHPVMMDQAAMDKYYQQYHPLFSLLPESGRVAAIVSNVDTLNQQAFVIALDLLPDLRAKTTVNGSHDSAMNLDLDPAISTARKSLKSHHFESYDSLQEYLFQQASAPSPHRSEDNNITLVWIMVLLALGSENDVKRLKDGGTMNKSRLVQLGRFVLEKVRSEDAENSTLAATGNQTRYPDEVNQAYNCLCLLLKYHALSLGISVNALVLTPCAITVRDLDAQKMPLQAAYIASSSNVVGHLSQIVLASANGNRFAYFGKLSLQTHFDNHFALYDGYLQDTTIAKQLHCFLELGVAPYEGIDSATPVDPTDTLMWVDKLTTVLIEDSQATSSAPRFNPLDLHTWSVAAFTLCEFVTDVGNKAMAEFAGKRLNDLGIELQKKSDTFHKSYDFEWFYGGKMEHWTDTLLTMIEYIKTRPAAADEGHGDDMLTVPRFAELMERGWLNGVLFFAKKD